MGSVAKLIRDRDARANTRRVSRWDVLWLLATSAAWVVGAVTLPRALSPWADAIVWVCCAAAWVILVAATEYILFRFRNRRKPAEAGAPRQELRGWRLSMYLCVLLVPVEVNLSVYGRGGGDWSWLRCFAVLMMVAVARAVSALVRHHDALRRRNEVADLAQQF